MVGYADPCPLCGNNKRRRFGHASHSDDGTHPRFPHPSLPLRPKSKSDPTPLPAPPTAEIVIPSAAAGAKKPTSPPAATASGSAGAAAPAAGGVVPAPFLPKAPLWTRPGIASILSPEPRGDSNSTTAAFPPTFPVGAVPAAATARASSSPEASGSRRRLGTNADESGKEEGANSKKGERSEAPRAAAAKEPSGEEDMEVAAMRIRCNCGRVQELLYRQKRTTT